MSGRVRTLLDRVRKPGPPLSRPRRLRNSLLLLAAGLAAGILAKCADFWTQNLGNLLSELSFWVFAGTVAAVFSHSPGRAAGNVLLFSSGMLLAYYLTAELAGGYYSISYVGADG